MALQDILEKIRAEAEKTVEKIFSDFEREKSEMEASSKKREEEDLRALERKMQEIWSSVEAKTQSMARREKSKMILATKQRIIGEFLKKLQTRLESAPDELYGKIIKRLLQKITDKKGVIVVPEKRRDLMKSLCPSGFEIKTDKHLLGGFVFKSSKGSQIDNSFKTLIFSEFRSDLELYFSEQLKFI